MVRCIFMLARNWRGVKMQVWINVELVMAKPGFVPNVFLG
jgi:hypothetical protein